MLFSCCSGGCTDIQDSGSIHDGNSDNETERLSRAGGSTVLGTTDTVGCLGFGCDT
jgi:hypothetical protein